MGYFLWTGTIIGAVLGLLHGGSLYCRLVARDGDQLRGIYFGLWAAVLWTVFGAYLLAFWLVGSIGMSISRLAGKGSRERLANKDTAI